MAATRTYKARALVLRKVKLGEKDLVVSMLAQDGSLVRAVAKGARKPGGSLASRLELFSVADVLLAKGRALDVVAEARFSQGHESRAWGLEQTLCASAVAELLCTVAQEGLEHPRLFDMSVTALETIAESDAEAALAATAAALLKILASSGYRPSFETCVYCGCEVPLDEAGGRVPLSLTDGGVVCADCRPKADCILVEATTISWAKYLTFAKFSEIRQSTPDLSTLFAVLQFARQWAQTHTAKDIKSMNALFTMGLF